MFLNDVKLGRFFVALILKDLIARWTIVTTAILVTVQFDDDCFVLWLRFWLWLLIRASLAYRFRFRFWLLLLIRASLAYRFRFRLWLWLLIRASWAYRLRIKFIFLSQLFRLLFYVGMATRMAEVAPHPMNMFPAIGRRKGIDINTSFVIGSACYAELSPVVDLTLRSVFADDP